MKVMKTKVLAVILAALFAVSSAFLVSTVKAGAVSKGSASSHASEKMEGGLAKITTKANTFAKSFEYKVSAKSAKNFSWSSSASAKNIKTKYSYSASAKKHVFKMTGTSYGLSKFTLTYKENGKTTKVTMKLFIDSQKNIMRVK
jgi:hypothetical protein